MHSRTGMLGFAKSIVIFFFMPELPELQAIFLFYAEVAELQMMMVFLFSYRSYRTLESVTRCNALY